MRKTLVKHVQLGYVSNPSNLVCKGFQTICEEKWFAKSLPNSSKGFVKGFNPLKPSLKDTSNPPNQRAKKVVSDSPVQVDFAIGLVKSVLNLPDEQVKFFEEFKLLNNCVINLAYRKVFGAS